MNGFVGPTALVSWAHRDEDWSDLQSEEWIEKVVQFSTLLMSNGVTVSLDLWSETDPDVDWTRWGQRQVQNCDLVLILVSDAWRQRWEGTNSPHLGAGVVSEADTLKGVFNEDQLAFQRKALLVLLPGVGKESIPLDLHRLQWYRITSMDARGIEPLLRRIYGRPLHARPVRKDAPELPAKLPGDAAHGAASSPIAAKRGELDEIKAGDPDAGSSSDHSVSLSKPPLGEAPRTRKGSLWAKVTIGGVVAALITFAAFANNASGALKNFCDMARWSVCSTSPSPSASPNNPTAVDVTPQPLPPETDQAKLAAAYDGTNPSGCADAGTSTIDTLQIKRLGTDNPLATVQIKHAPKCNTTWVRVINTLDGSTVNKVVERRAGDGLAAFKSEVPEFSGNFSIPGRNTSYGNQVYAPGCVTASVQITDAAGSLAGELPPQEFCWISPPS
ncbi:SEFIR domain-containing protein [Paenarthrobacter nitroguajacolicus]|uniref:SEFIR domain-containing protein n=1 Tax=Paenarthrobacter nitroguajacolicus TaxID=211146 RepID=UPI00248B7799|nr:SEFIR domain-containing protein [Paenarthrobacter nitroguajacolicus]MDI2036853.1 hypothetical protein [Paenarthrobacter nitroguajacolicus]